MTNLGIASVHANMLETHAYMQININFSKTIVKIAEF